mgnify:CR=1 FL=1
MYERLFRIFWKNISGERAKRLCAEIYMSDVRQTLSAFWNSAKLIAQELKDSGIEDVKIIEQKADGKTKYGDWITPQGWEVEKAYVKIIEPKDMEGILTSYDENPVSLATLSASTPNGGITTELLSWEDLKDKSAISGKVVLTSKRMREIRDEAMEYGALGIISYWLPGERRFLVPDANYWENYCFVPRNIWGGFGFTISPRKGELLRELCRKGKVKVHVEVKTKFLDATIPIVTGVIPGEEEDREVILVAHLYEVGANDNASGCATCVEILRTINDLISKGDLPRPRRSIRVILGYECYALMAYLTMFKERITNMIAGLNLDMVGEDQDLCKSVLLLSVTHPAARAFTDYLLMRLLEIAKSLMPRFTWRVRETGIYMIHDGSILSDPMIDVPTPALINWPDMFYHSNLDTPDKVSPNTLRLVGTVGATYVYFIANAHEKEVRALAQEVFNAARKRILDIASTYVHTLVLKGHDVDRIVGDAIDKIDFITEVEERAIRSVLRIHLNEKLKEEVDELCLTLRDFAKQEKKRILSIARGIIGRGVKPERPAIKVPKDMEEAMHLVPVRKVLGVPTLVDLPKEALMELRSITSESYPYSRLLCAPLFWANGRRSIAEIAEEVRKELGKSDIAFLVKLFKFLEKYGYVTLKKRSK